MISFIGILETLSPLPLQRYYYSKVKFFIHLFRYISVD